MRKVVLTFAAVLFFFAAEIFGQTGGSFEIKQSVIAAGGGQNSAGGVFSIDGTTGQAAAGNALAGTPFAVTSGFWNFAPLAATAAEVSVGGRVITANGHGIRNVRVTLTAPNGETRFAVTGTFGYYRFEQIPVGEVYVVSVFSKRFTFSQPTVVRTVLDEISDLDFVAENQP